MLFLPLSQTTHAAVIELIPMGAEWHYWDKGSPGNDWYKPAYNHSIWTVGKGQLGYGEGDETTVLNFGNNKKKKRLAYYFRKQVDVQHKVTKANISITYDDGFILFINGREALRKNLPAGVVGDKTSAIENKNEHQVIQSYAIDEGLFTAGNNIIAVGVFQRNRASSDVSFDLKLNIQTAEPVKELVKTDVTEPLKITESAISTAETKIDADIKDTGSSKSQSLTLSQLCLIFIWIETFICSIAIAPKSGLGKSVIFLAAIPFFGTIIFFFILAFSQWPLHHDLSRLKAKLKR